MTSIYKEIELIIINQEQWYKRKTVKIKEAIFINLMKPSLNQQVNHVNLKLSL